jgi:8-oxo-dGTP pyrophosphatase MutT (NUDIX family)
MTIYRESLLNHTHFGVYGFIAKAGNILVIEKARGPYLGMFDLPGGSPEQGESHEETLKREFYEELGVVPTSYKRTFEEIQTIDFHYKKNGEMVTLKHSAMLYHVVDFEGKVKSEGDGEDCLRPLWVPAQKLNVENATPFLRMMIDLDSKKS